MAAMFCLVGVGFCKIMRLFLDYIHDDDEVLMHAGLLRPMAEGGYLRVPHV